MRFPKRRRLEEKEKRSKISKLSVGEGVGFAQSIKNLWVEGEAIVIADREQTHGHVRDRDWGDVGTFSLDTTRPRSMKKWGGRKGCCFHIGSSIKLRALSINNFLLFYFYNFVTKNRNAFPPLPFSFLLKLSFFLSFFILKWKGEVKFSKD